MTHGNLVYTCNTTCHDDQHFYFVYNIHNILFQHLHWPWPCTIGASYTVIWLWYDILELSIVDTNMVCKHINFLYFHIYLTFIWRLTSSCNHDVCTTSQRTKPCLRMIYIFWQFKIKSLHAFWLTITSYGRCYTATLPFHKTYACWHFILHILHIWNICIIQGTFCHTFSKKHVLLSYTAFT